MKTRTNNLKMCLFIPAFLCLLLGQPGFSQTGPTRVAALDVADPFAVLSDAEKSMFGYAVRSAARSALPSDKYIIMTRDNIFELIPPNMEIEECVGDCAIETGRNLGARHVLTGEASLVGDVYRISLSLYDTETANLLGTGRATGRDFFDLESDLVQETTKLMLILPGAAPDQMGIRVEAEQIRRGMVSKRNRTNRFLTLGAGLATGVSAYFHVSASSNYDDHLAADNPQDAEQTWSDYESGITNRDITLGVVSGLILWRLVRSFGDVPATEEIRQDLIQKRRLQGSLHWDYQDEQVLCTYRVRF